MVAKSIAKIYTNIHKPTDYKRIETVPSFIKALKTHNLYRRIMLTF